MKENYNLIPLISLGPFKFGSNIKEYNKFNFEYHKSDTKTNWDHYIPENIDIEIYVEEGIIESIACRKQCIFNGKNIIGMEISEFISICGKFPDLNQTDTIFIGDENKPQIIYEFDDIGLQVWVKDGIIETVFCSPFIEDD